MGSGRIQAEQVQEDKMGRGGTSTMVGREEDLGETRAVTSHHHITTSPSHHLGRGEQIGRTHWRQTQRNKHDEHLGEQICETNAENRCRTSEATHNKAVHSSSDAKQVNEKHSKTQQVMP